jgi:hypothetical protein
LSWRTVICGTGQRGRACSTTAVVHAVRGWLRAVVVAGTSRETSHCNSVAEGRSLLISVPGVSSLAISVCSAVKANSVCHAVGTLSSSAIVVVITSHNALSRSLVAVRLSHNLATITSRTGGARIGDNTLLARSANLAVSAGRSSSGARIGCLRGIAAVSIYHTIEGIVTNTGRTTLGLPCFTSRSRNIRRTVYNSAVW